MEADRRRADLELVRSMLASALPSSHLELTVNTALDIIDNLLADYRVSDPDRSVVLSSNRGPVNYRSVLNEYAQENKRSIEIHTTGSSGAYIVEIDGERYESDRVRKKDAIDDACRFYLESISPQ